MRDQSFATVFIMRITPDATAAQQFGLNVLQDQLLHLEVHNIVRPDEAELSEIVGARR